MIPPVKSTFVIVKRLGWMKDSQCAERRNPKLLERAVLEKLPREGAAIKNLYRRARFLQRRAGVKARLLLGGHSVPDPERVYWIDPKRIVYYTNYCNGDRGEFERRAPERIRAQSFRDQVFDREKDKGRVCGGDWDLSSYRFSELHVYQAIESRINDDAPWEGTEFFKSALRRIEAGEHLWKCRNEGELAQRCRYIDAMIESIRENGYRLNSDVAIEGDDTSALTKHKLTSQEITVNIGRDGSYLFQDSRHRLAIAQILGLDAVPVKVLVRHEKWQELRELLASMIKGRGGASKAGRLYQPALHPDLSDFPASHGCEDRWVAMRACISGDRRGNLLDVGANLGYFCHRFEDLGYTCHAVELLHDVAFAADRIRVAEGKRFRVINSDLFEALEQSQLEDTGFDVVLTLNILHHFLKTERSYDRLVGWLKRLKVDTMFFEPHRDDDPQMQTAYRNFKEQEFVDFVLKHTGLTRAQRIFQAHDDRHVYALSR